MGLAESVKKALEPYIGATAADTCVRATALSLGKSSDVLRDDDLPALIANVSRLMSHAVPHETVDRIIASIEEEVR